MTVNQWVFLSEPLRGIRQDDLEYSLVSKGGLGWITSTRASTRRIEYPRSKGKCDFVLHVISTVDLNVPTVARLVDDCNRMPEKVVLLIVHGDRAGNSAAAVRALRTLVEKGRGMVFASVDDAIRGMIEKEPVTCPRCHHAV